MGAVTYPDPTVESYVNSHFIPVQFNVVEQPELKDQFCACWTPTLIIQDAEGREHRRSEGFHDQKRFLGEMALGRLKTVLNQSNFDAAQSLSEEALERTQGDEAREPEALFWHAVSTYKATGEVQELLKVWDQIMAQFPGSEWGKRAEYTRFV